MGIYTGLKSAARPLLEMILVERVRLPSRLIELRLASMMGNKTSERIVEYPWLLDHLKMMGRKKILDVGCGPEALMASYLLSRGYDVYGMDIVESKALPSGRFILADARRTEIRDSSFDIIILLSTLEHIGSDESDDDRKTIKELSRILTRGGIIFLTTPIAEEYSNRGQRFYSRDRLGEVISGMRILEEGNFLQKGRRWLRVNFGDVASATHGYLGTDAIAIVTMVLKRE